MNSAMASFNTTVRQMTEMSHRQEADLPRTYNYFTKKALSWKIRKRDGSPWIVEASAPTKINRTKHGQNM